MPHPLVEFLFQPPTPRSKLSIWWEGIWTTALGLSLISIFIVGLITIFRWLTGL